MIIDYILVGTIIALLGEKLYKTMRKGDKKSNDGYLASFKESLDLCQLPVITVEQEKAGKINLLLDTGASTSFIDLDFISKYVELPKDTTYKELVTGGNMSSMLNVKVETKINIKEKLYNMEFHVCSLSNVITNLKQEYGVNIHGIIGNDFLEKHKYIINYSNYKIYEDKK